MENAPWHSQGKRDLSEHRASLAGNVHGISQIGDWAVGFAERMSKEDAGCAGSGPGIEWKVSHNPDRTMQLFPWAACPVPSHMFTAAISSVSQMAFAARDPSPWCLCSVLLLLRSPSFQPLTVHLVFCHPVKAIFPVAMMLGLSAFWKQAFPRTRNGYG